MKILSIGVLAFNEATGIGKTLCGLLEQKAFQPDNWRLEIIVVANGCTDGTAEVARTTLAKLTSKIPEENISWRVEEVPKPGKCNAWNLYVHQFSHPDANYLTLADGDIIFPENSNILWKVVETLETDQAVWVATDMPVKKRPKCTQNWFVSWLLVRNNAIKDDGKGICGQFYCGRSEILKKVYFPGELPVEDGYLRALILTNFFTSDESFDRIQRTPEAYHFFEVPGSWKSMIAHEKRMLIGSTINFWIFEYFWKVCSPDLSAVDILEKETGSDPDWLRNFVRQNLSVRKKWAIHPSLVFRRVEALRHLPAMALVKKLPTAIPVFLLTLYIAFQANRDMQKTGGIGYW